jgi:hypothetical protein
MTPFTGTVSSRELFPPDDCLVNDSSTCVVAKDSLTENHADSAKTMRLVALRAADKMPVAARLARKSGAAVSGIASRLLLLSSPVENIRLVRD